MAPPTTQPVPSSSACSASSTASGPSSPKLLAEALSTDCRQPPPRSQPNRAVMTASRPIFWHRDRRAWLTAGEDLLAEDVGVASVAGEFLHHVHVHPAQGQGAAPVV